MRRTLFRSSRAAISLLVAISLCTPSLEAQNDSSADPVLGTWRGELVAGPQRLEVALHISKGGDAGGYQATFDSVTQKALGIPVSKIDYSDGELVAVLAIGAKYTARLQTAADDEPARLVGTFEQGGAKLPLTLEASAEAAAPPPARPQNPKPPFPYRIEEVRFGHDTARPLAQSFVVGELGDAPASHVTLAGTLTVPPGEGPHPAVALVTGSGPQDRDESLLGHKPFWVLADHLTRSGIAVLRYDDRGTAESTGDFMVATSGDFAVDAAAALRFLGTREDIDKSRLGLIGHSEGGIIAPLVAAGPDAELMAFAVLLAPPGVNIKDIILHQSKLISAADGTPEEEIEISTEITSRVLDAVGRHPEAEVREVAIRKIVEDYHAGLPEAVRASKSVEEVLQQTRQADLPWMHWLLGVDPADSLRTMRGDVLAVFGTKDLQVDPAQNRPPLEAALKRSAARSKVVTLEGLNHLFQHAETGSPGEYASLEETMAPEVLELVSTWLRGVTGLDG